MKSTGDLLSIAKAGGSLKISAANKSTGDLLLIATALYSEKTLHLTNCGNKSTGDLLSIAKAGEGKVTFDFS